MMLIEKRCGHIDKRNGTAGSGCFEVVSTTFHVATHNHGENPMTKILTLCDRSALTLINLLVVAGLPLAAVALVTNAL
jgi:hypothetical protein